MATPKRARGANIRYRIKAETSYGIRPAGNWRTGSAFSFDVDLEQPLEDVARLGQGPERQTPLRGAKDVTGPVEVPVDQRLIYDYLVPLLGAPGVAVQLGARGFIQFSDNPADLDTITLAGTDWTFVAGTPAGNQTQIGASLQDTLDALVIDLNGSAEAAITPATYSRLGDRLVIVHDTADATGNSYTLAASSDAAIVSHGTLTGGGFWQRKWEAGVPTEYPSFSAEIEHTDMEAGSDRFASYSGCQVNGLTIGRTRSGAVRAALQIIAQKKFEHAASVAGTPVSLAEDLFSQFQGDILISDRPVANVTAASLSINPNAEILEELRFDGYIGGTDGGQFNVDLNLTARYSNNALKAAASAASTVSARFGFLDRPSGAELLFEIHEIHLPEPRKPITGPGGISVEYAGLGTMEGTLGRALTVTLINDVANYAIA